MGTTPLYGIPYVEPTDLLANYPVADKAKADRLEVLLTMGCSARHRNSGDIAMGAGTDVTIDYNGILVDDPVNLPYASGTWTVKLAGVYLIAISTFWQAVSAVGPTQYTKIYRNGVSGPQAIQYPTTTARYSTQNLVNVNRYAVNDTIKIVCNQSVNAGSIMANSGGQQTSCSITRVGP
jgi:hypothetical protein